MTDVILNTISELDELVSNFRNEVAEKHDVALINILYRGQTNFNWNLTSSLERKYGGSFTMANYDKLLRQIKPAIETFTEKKWSLTNFDDVDDGFRQMTIPNYEFMAYVRHHGFPTPLLDWTKSIYVALYFACNKISENTDAALFLYVDELRIGSGGWVGETRVFAHGEYISPHIRHYNQQSSYTTSTSKIDDEWYYSSHQDYFDQSSKQYLISKIRIPTDRKKELLKELDSMNINAFTLFGSEDSMMEMLWNREGMKWDFLGSDGTE